MDATLFEIAYARAAAHYKEATSAVFRDVSSANPKGEFDEIFQLSARAMELHVSSLKLAVRIWARSISYEKAEESIVAQFPEFPAEVCRKALSASHANAR